MTVQELVSLVLHRSDNMENKHTSSPSADITYNPVTWKLIKVRFINQNINQKIFLLNNHIYSINPFSADHFAIYTVGTESIQTPLNLAIC